MCVYSSRSWLVVFVFVAVCPSILLATEGSAEGARFISTRGYGGCVELSNQESRVVLDPNLGGRVLSYSLENIESLHVDVRYDGATASTLSKELPGSLVPGGRADVGPELTQANRAIIWLGSWKAEITGDRRARLTSQVDSSSGLQIVRDFQLDGSSSTLRFRQTIKNVGSEARQVSHWGRTFAAGGGLVVIPLNPRSRFPARFIVQLEPGGIVYRPAHDAKINRKEGALIIESAPVASKIMTDSEEGWMAYFVPAGLLFLKKYSVLPSAVYGEIASYSTAVWFGPDNRMCELEPIGPLVDLEPGNETIFEEVWTLLRAETPTVSAIDVGALRKMARNMAPDGSVEQGM